MAENEFEKTVKLTPGNPPPTPKTPTPSSDQTVKLTPQEDKTVRLTPPPAVPSPDPQPASVAPPPPQPDPGITIIPPPSSAFESAKLNGSKKTIIFTSLIAVLGGIWVFLPPWLMKRAEKAAKEGNHASAAQTLKWASALYPLHRDSYLALMGKELRLSKDYSNSQKSLEMVLKHKPDSYFLAMKELGMTLREVGQSQKAFESLQNYSQLHPTDTEALGITAQLAFELKNYESSSELLKTLTGLQGAKPEDWQKLGISYFELGRLDESEKALLNASEKNKQLKGTYVFLAQIYASQGKFAESAEKYKMELSLSPEDPGLAESFAESSWQAGIASSSEKKWKEAVQFFEDGLSVPSSRTADFHYELAKIYLKIRRRSSALSSLKKSLQENPGLKSKARRDRSFLSLRNLAGFRRMVR